TGRSPGNRATPPPCAAGMDTACSCLVWPFFCLEHETCCSRPGSCSLTAARRSFRGTSSPRRWRPCSRGWLSFSSICAGLLARRRGAVVALATLAIGAAGVLWTISEQVLSTWLNHPVGEWRDKVSLFITLMLVGAPMWRSHWPGSPPAEERYALSRRLYLSAS